MKILMKYILTAILFSALTATAFPQESDSDHITIPLTDPSRAATVNVEIFTGSITVRGYDGNEVIVDMEYPGNNKPPKLRQADTAGLKKISSTGGTVIDEDNNTVRIRRKSFIHPTSIKLQVPRRTSLVLKTATQGDIKIEQVHGEMEISNISGDVTLTNVAGSVVANTQSGDVNVILREIDPDKPMSFSTMSGNIDVSFPADLKADVSMNSMNGEIYSGFDINIDSNENRVRADDSGGNDKFRMVIDSTIKGSINGGGPEIQFRTFNGHIYLRKLSQ